MSNFKGLGQYSVKSHGSALFSLQQGCDGEVPTHLPQEAREGHVPPLSLVRILPSSVSPSLPPARRFGMQYL